MTAEELSKIAEIEQEARAQYRHTLNVCMAAGCLSCRSDQVKDALSKEVARLGLDRYVQVRGVGCLGPCAGGPLVQVTSGDAASGEATGPAGPAGVLYHQVGPDDAVDLVGSLETKPIERLRLDQGSPFFTCQKKVVLENSGRIDPERVEEYIAEGGYFALHQALTTMKPEEVVAAITRSGLRGRGGAGFPTGLKWGTVAKAPAGSRGKFVICNADEGDPGAFMDRSVLESDPHRVLEGMALAAYAVGASKGFIYCRAEYPLAIKRLKLAIRQAERLGLLGNNVFQTPLNFTVEVRLGAGAFVCGEETALIASIEGKRGQPRPRPPYPAQSGLWGCPTLINNVETIASVPTIMRKGPDWYAAIGTEKSKGTKVFALAGRVKNTGLVEVPMGMTLRQIIFDIGGGVPEGRKFKAVQTGGPSGGCIPEQFLDMPVDYESLAQVGSIMGSGGMIVMDDTSSMVDVARFFMEFCMGESCGKCVPCRVGTAQMHDLLVKLIKGQGTAEDLTLLQDLCEMVRSTSLCGLGMSAPNPVLTTLRYFRHEYDALIQRSAGARGKDASPVPAAAAAAAAGVAAAATATAAAPVQTEVRR